MCPAYAQLKQGALDPPSPPQIKKIINPLPGMMIFFSVQTMRTNPANAELSLVPRDGIRYSGRSDRSSTQRHHMTIHARFTALVAVTIATITLLSTPATAQPYIEIAISGSMQDNVTGDEYKPFGLRAIFDAGAAPDGVFGNSIQFEAIWGEAIDTSALTSTSMASPFGVLEDEYLPADVFFSYIQSINSYQVLAFVNDDIATLQVTDPIGAFSLAMTSLPDALVDYQIFQKGFGEIVGPVLFSTPQGSAFWNGDSSIASSTGSIHVTFRFVDGPPEPECLVDLNNDGALDFFDISTFLTLFGAGCP